MASSAGTFAVQLAHAFGARVTGVCSTAKTDLVRSIGADDVIVGGEGGGRWLGGFYRQILRAPIRSAFTGQRLRAVISKERTEDLQHLTTLIEDGTVTPVINRTFPLHEAPQAIRYLAQGHPAGKIVVTV